MSKTTAIFDPSTFTGVWTSPWQLVKTWLPFASLQNEVIRSWNHKKSDASLVKSTTGALVLFVAIGDDKVVFAPVKAGLTPADVKDSLDAGNAEEAVAEWQYALDDPSLNKRYFVAGPTPAQLVMEALV